MKFQYIITNITFIIILWTLIFTNINLVITQSIDDSLIFEDRLSGVQFKYSDEWVKEGSSLYRAETECSQLPCVKLPEISVSVSPIATEDFSLENYTKEQTIYHEFADDYKPISINNTNFGDRDVFQYVYSTQLPFLMEHVSGEMMNYDIYFTEGINLYKISLKSVVDEKLNTYLDSFHHIMNTLKINT